MRISLKSVALSLLAFSLPVAVVADEPITSIATVTSTRTVYRVTTETQTGTPSAFVQNTTSTIKPTAGTVQLSTASMPTQPSNTVTAIFTGAATKMGNMDAAAAAVVAVAGLMML